MINAWPTLHASKPPKTPTLLRVSERSHGVGYAPSNSHKLPCWPRIMKRQWQVSNSYELVLSPLESTGGSSKTLPRADTCLQAPTGCLGQCRMQDMALLTSKSICRGRSTAGSPLGLPLLKLDTSQEHGRNRGRQTRYVYCKHPGALPSGVQDRNACVPSPFLCLL